MSRLRAQLPNYIVVISSVLLALLLRLMLRPILGDHVPYITFFLAVAVSAWHGGLPSGIAAIGLSLLAAAAVAVPPEGRWFPTRASDWLGMVLFALIGLIISWLAQRAIHRRSQLWRERERFQTTLASIGDGVIVTDTDARVTFLNAVAQQLTGWNETDARGRPLQDIFRIVNEQTRLPVESPVEKSLREGVIVGLANHTILIARDGVERAIDDSASPIRDEWGQMTGVVLVFRDVSEHRAADRAMRESELMFRTLADSVPALIWMTKADGSCEFLNRPWLEFTGRTFEEELSGAWGQGLHPDDRPRWVEAFQTAQQRQTEFLMEFRHRRSDGEFRWLLNRGQPRFHENGEFAGFIGSCVDITDRRQTEDEVHRNENLLQRMFEASNVGIILTDPVTERFLRVNGKFRQITGYSTDELLEKTFTEILHEDDRASVRELYSRLVAGEIPEYSVEKRYLRKTGEVIWTQVNSVMLRHVDGKPRYKLAIVQDISDRKAVETALQESEERFRTLAINAPTAIYIKDLEGRYTLANERVAVALKHPDEVIGLTDHELMPAVLADQRRARDLEVMTTGRTWEGEEVVGPPGEERYLLSVKFPLISGSGKCTGVCGVSVDITDRKRTEQLLRESEEQFRLLSNSIPQLAWMAGPDGQIEWYNQRWYEFTGTTSEQMLADGWEPLHEPADLQRVKGKWQKSLAEGTPWEDTFRLRRHDGVYRWYLSQALPLHDSDGQIIRWFGTNTDITESQHTKSMLRFLAEASRSLATLVDDRSALQKMAHLAIPDFADWCAVDVVGADGGMERVAIAHSNEELMHWALEFRERRPPRSGDRFSSGSVMPHGKSVLTPEVTLAMLEQLADNDPEALQQLKQLGLISSISVPLLAHEQLYGVITFATAESGRRFTESDLKVAEDLAHRATIAIENSRLYERIREADARKDEFLAMLSHELRNPLAPIRSGLDVLAMEQKGDPEMLQLMQQQVDHLVRLVDDLLDVSRIIRGRIELRRETVELSELIERATNAMRPMLRSQHQTLSIQLPQDPVTLFADPVRLVQVFENLINNASKYSDPGSQINITASRFPDGVEINVRDQGIGIDPELLPKVFDLFTQATRSLDRSQGGLGIGLTLVKRLVEMHGGSVAVFSEGVGRGSEFSVRLPAIRNIGPRAAAVQLPQRGTTRRKILVVDDNVGNARIASALLCKLGDHEIQQAHDGTTALERVGTWHPDLVLLDIGLPGIDGYEVGRRIRQNPSNDNILLVALTGYGQEEDRRRSKDVGFDEHLVKPISLSELQRILLHPKLDR